MDFCHHCVRALFTSPVSWTKRFWGLPLKRVLLAEKSEHSVLWLLGNRSAGSTWTPPVLWDSGFVSFCPSEGGGVDSPVNVAILVACVPFSLWDGNGVCSIMDYWLALPSAPWLSRQWMHHFMGRPGPRLGTISLGLLIWGRLASGERNSSLLLWNFSPFVHRMGFLSLQ